MSNTTQPNLSLPSRTQKTCRQSFITAYLDQSALPNRTTSATKLLKLPIYYNNVRCITNKRNIAMHIELSIFKVLCFTETWLTDRQLDADYFPSCHNVYRLDRIESIDADRHRRSGGVAILVRYDIPSRRIKLPHDPDCEIMAVEINVKPCPVIIVLSYMRKFDNVIATKHYLAIRNAMENYITHRIIVLGDFNIHDVNWKLDEAMSSYLPDDLSHRDGQYYRYVTEFLHNMISLPLYQVSNIENVANNVLDLIFVSDANLLNVVEDLHTVIDIDQQDTYHKPIELLIDCANNENVTADRNQEVYCYKNGNYQRICQKLNEVNFAHEFNLLNTESAFEYFYGIINSLICNNVPKIVISKKTNRPKWWNSELQRLKNLRNKWFKRKAMGTCSNEQYADVLNEFKTLSDRCQNEYIDKVQSNIKSNAAEFWKYAKLVSKSSTYPSVMHYADTTADTVGDIVELFADYFESTYFNDEESTDFNEIYRTERSFGELSVTMFDIERSINSLKWKGGCGPDGIAPFVVKMCVGAMVWPLWLLYQKSFDSGEIPEKLKQSRVVPVFKKGNRADVTNYRIIAISSVFLKIFERAIKFKLSTSIEPLLSNAQHGFRTNRSVSTNLLNLSMTVHDAFRRKHQVDIFYGDFKNAFDKVSHMILIGKLVKFNVGKKTAKWLFEFLTNRTNFVKIGSSRSRCYKSLSGVPAGSALGPLLFSIFIDDIVEVLNDVNVLLFADDVKIFKEMSCNNDYLVLQGAINSVIGWCNRNRLFFNREKCAVFTASRVSIDIHEYYILNYLVIRKTEIRDLGVLLDCKLNFAHHIEQITNSARQMIGYIKRISNGRFTIDTQRVLYLAYVRSKLEFASVIWNNYQRVYIDDIESIQKQFVIYLLGSRRNATSFRLTPYCDRCKLLNIQPLEIRRKILDAMFAYDIFKQKFNDTDILRRVVRLDFGRALRFVRLVEEETFIHDYLRYQTIARMLNLINEYGDLMMNCSSRVTFRLKISNAISQSYG